MATYFRSVFFVLAAALMLAGCSSKPSPWGQSSSPWTGKTTPEQELPAAEESAVAGGDQSGFVETVEPEPVFVAVEPLEPIKPVVTEPVVPEVVMAENEQAIEEAPVVAAPAVGGDLRGQPAGHFAVQVCASRTMKQLEAFAKRHNLSVQLATSTNVKGETWIVLLEGVYPTRAEATAALARVSALVDTKPWIRTMSSLQAVMQ